MLSASGSSDANGDNLTFTWSQTAGPTVLPGGTISATNLTVNSPNVDTNTILTFQLSASDGTVVSTDTVTVTVEPLGFQDTGLFFATITGLTDNNYAIIGNPAIGTNGLINIETQNFSSDGSPIGAPVIGSLSTDPITGNVSFGLERIIQSGPTDYNIFSGTIDTMGFGGPEEIFLSTIRGALDQDFPNIGDIYAQFSRTSQFLGFDAVPIGTDQLATIAILPSTGAGRDIVSHVVNPDGTLASSAILATAPFAVSPAITIIDENSYAGFWLANNQINMQVVENDGDLVGPTVTMNSSGSFDLSATQLQNNQIMIVTSEGDNFTSMVTARIVDSSGTLQSQPVIIGDGTDVDALLLNDGNVLIIWDGGGGGNGLLGRIISPTGTFVTDTHILSPERQLSLIEPIQLAGGNILISDGIFLLNFPIDAIDFFPPLPQ